MKTPPRPLTPEVTQAIRDYAARDARITLDLETDSRLRVTVEPEVDDSPFTVTNYTPFIQAFSHSVLPYVEPHLPLVEEPARALHFGVTCLLFANLASLCSCERSVPCNNNESGWVSDVFADLIYPANEEATLTRRERMEARAICGSLLRTRGAVLADAYERFLSEVVAHVFTVHTPTDLYEFRGFYYDMLETILEGALCRNLNPIPEVIAQMKRLLSPPKARKNTKRGSK